MLQYKVKNVLKESQNNCRQQATFQCLTPLLSYILPTTVTITIVSTLWVAVYFAKTLQTLQGF